ncbi:MAG: class II fructose-bisphosphate aldolase [Chloroflexota bacterium]
MPLVGTREMLYRAMEERYAVGAFNVSCLDLVRPIVEAAEAERAPVILQMAPAQIDFMSLHLAAATARAAAEAARVPVAVHLDHGDTYVRNVACLRAGFTSLMFDGSSLPYEENVRITRQIVEFAHAVGIGVEAELGSVLRIANNPSEDDIAASLTDPAQAKAFVEETGADFLAVAVGTVHNMVKRSARIDLARIRAIRDQAKRPLVIHGGSGIPHEVIAEAVAGGICKFNVATELIKQLRLETEKVYAERPTELNPRVLMPPALAVVRETTAEKIRLFGSSGKAF